MDSLEAMEEEMTSPRYVVPITQKTSEMSDLNNNTRILHVAHTMDHICGRSVARILGHLTIKATEQDVEIQDVEILDVDTKVTIIGTTTITVLTTITNTEPLKMAHLVTLTNIKM
jgi:hypothetical protein